MLDLEREHLISFSEAAKLLPPNPNGATVHPKTVARWALHGLCDPRGHVVKLDSAKVGRRRMTSREAVQRFSDTLTSGEVCGYTATERDDHDTRIERQLRELGV